LIAGVRRRLKYLGRPAINDVVAHALKIEGFGYFPDDRRGLFFFLAYSLGPLLWSLPLQFVELLR